MKLQNIIIICFSYLLLFSGCNKDYDVPVPDTGPDSILDQTDPLSPGSQSLMEGVYKVISNSGRFGDQVILKWNRTSLSFACSNGVYFIMNAGQLDSMIYIHGYWRDGYSDATGLCSMQIAEQEGGKMIINGIPTTDITIRGNFGEGDDPPELSLTLEYIRPFSEKTRNTRFNILAHRGGGRTSDNLPVSENSIEMLNFTEKLGSTGVELDVRLTSDDVAFIYHDDDINTRLTMKGPLAGPINKYRWNEISTYIRLIHGEKIPSLEDALNFIVDSTLLDFVYLDIKEEKPVMSVVIPLQQKIMMRASDKGRDVAVLIGIPTTDVMEDFMAWPGYQDILSLCELSVDDVRTLNSRVWAPRWTLGTQNDLVSQLHDEGRLAICWTIDNPAWIKDYIENGLFDGLLTNFPYVVAYYHYIQE